MLLIMLKLVITVLIAGQVDLLEVQLGNNVMIGGRAGEFWSPQNWQQCSNWWRGNCIKDIPDNTKVMGYPAKNIKQF